MPTTSDFRALDEFLQELESAVPLSVFFPLAAEHKLIGPNDWQGWAAARLAEAAYAERWMTSLRDAQTVSEVRDALSERTESVPVSGYWGYYDLLEVGMRCVGDKLGRMTFADVLAESTGSLHHAPVRLEEEMVVAALAHARGTESHGGEFTRVQAVCRRLGEHAERLFDVVGVRMNPQPKA